MTVRRVIAAELMVTAFGCATLIGYAVTLSHDQDGDQRSLDAARAHMVADVTAVPAAEAANELAVDQTFVDLDERVVESDAQQQLWAMGGAAAAGLIALRAAAKLAELDPESKRQRTRKRLANRGSAVSRRLRLQREASRRRVIEPPGR
jgi:hypothetical protein